MALVLRELMVTDETAFLEAYRTFQDPKFVFALEYDPTQPFESYVAKLDAMKRGVDLPPDRVPATLLFGFVDAVVVGRLSFRHTLNDWLFKHGGHFGYGVVPQHRRMGYATGMLRSALPLAKERGLSKVLLIPTNAASRKVVEACGGEYESETEDGKGQRYWIRIPGVP
jgi:predicted acetyltransferase